MKFYAIPPNNHLDVMEFGDRFFCLAHHFLEDSNYRDFFLNLRERSPSVFITLDNSAAEHSLVTENDLLHVVSKLKPDEVVAPDVLFDKDKTTANLKSFTEKLYKHNLQQTTSIFGCPQGATKEEWFDCYLTMIHNPFVKCVGLSKITVPKCWNNAEGDTKIAESRNQCIQELSDMSLLLKPLHLLGMGEHTEFDFYLQRKTPCIRSSDSCYAVLAAINGIDFEQGDTRRIPTTNEYFRYSMSFSQKSLAKKNIEYLKTKYKDI